MKYLLILSTLLLYPLKEFCQTKKHTEEGFKYIEMAENFIQKGNLSKAEISLNKAKRCDYGFCGNYWLSAYEKINMLQYNIHIIRKDYKQALYQLDSIKGCGFGVNCNMRDSLKVNALVNIYGKNNVKESFNNINESAIKSLEESSIYLIYLIYLPELKYTFTFESYNYKIVVIDKIKRVVIKNNMDILFEFKSANYLKQLE